MMNKIKIWNTKEKYRFNLSHCSKKRITINLNILLWIVTFMTLQVSLSEQRIYGIADVTENNIFFNHEASLLKEIGLFKGSDVGFELERNATRAEAAVILVRLLGAEEEANANHYVHPFSDVPEWANACVGYLYKMGLTKGMDKDHYGSSEPISAQAFMTFCLRSLAFEDSKGDFTWSKATEKAYSLALIDASMKTLIESNTLIRRDTIVGILFNMLNQPRKDRSQPLINTLIQSDKIDLQFALENDLFVQPLHFSLKGQIVSINRDSFYIAFDQRNGVEYITSIPFSSIEVPFIGSMVVRSEDGKDYVVSISKEVYVEQLQTMGLNINDSVQIEGNLAIQVPRSMEGQIAINAESIQ